LHGKDFAVRGVASAVRNSLPCACNLCRAWLLCRAVVNTSSPTASMLPRTDEPACLFLLSAIACTW
jgi:hypothetical protein